MVYSSLGIMNADGNPLRFVIVEFVGPFCLHASPRSCGLNYWNLWFTTQDIGEEQRGVDPAFSLVLTVINAETEWLITA